MTEPSSHESSGTGEERARAPDPAAPRRPHIGRRLLWLCLMLVVGAGAYWYFALGGAALLAPGGGAPTAAAAGRPPPEVTVAKPLVRELIEWDEFTGQFQAVDDVEIRARVSGYLQSTHFEEGDLVEAGDLLFVIDPRPFETELSRAQAQLEEAEARFALAERQVERASQLRQRDFVAESTYDERVAEARQAQAGIQVAEAAVRAAELDLEFTQIKAPVSGRAGRFEVSIGNLVSGGSGGSTTLLTTIVSLDPIYLAFDVSEADFLAYKRAVSRGDLPNPGNDGSVPVGVRLFDEGNWPRDGRIDFVDNQVDSTTGTIRVRATVPNPDLFLVPGQFGRLRVPGSRLYEAVQVPDQAIVSDQARRVVMTVAADGTVVPKVVRPGPTEDGLRIIRGGLNPDDRVIIAGLMRARPGAKVTPVEGEITLPETAQSE